MKLVWLLEATVGALAVELAILGVETGYWVVTAVAAFCAPMWISRAQGDWEKRNR